MTLHKFSYVWRLTFLCELDGPSFSLGTCALALGKWMNGTWFAGVIAYVEVRCKTEDVSCGLEDALEKLGATVRKYMGPTVTHVVFRGGRVSTRNKAIMWNIPIVGPLWVEE